MRVNSRDIGGNSDKLVYHHHKSNLHSVWDKEMIETRIGELGEVSYSDFLINQIKKGSYKDLKDSWVSTRDVTEITPMNNSAVAIEYAIDSNSYSCKGIWSTFEEEEGNDYSGVYYQKMNYLVDLQLAKGGVRLAHHLNQVLATCAAPSSLARRR